jgi:hypothetical protein
VAGCRLLIESPTPLDALNRPLLPPTAVRTDISVEPVWTELPEPRPAPVLLTIDEVAAALASRSAIEAILLTSAGCGTAWIMS